MLENLSRIVAAGNLDISHLPQPSADSASLQSILNIVFAFTGGIAVLIIVLAGFRFIVSNGNPQEVSKARNAILYAVIGLLVIIFATAIVNFVLYRVT